MFGGSFGVIFSFLMLPVNEMKSVPVRLVPVLVSPVSSTKGRCQACSTMRFALSVPTAGSELLELEKIGSVFV